MSENREKQKEDLKVRTVICKYWRNSGKNCTKCQYYGTEYCIHSTNVYNHDQQFK